MTKRSPFWFGCSSKRDDVSVELGAETVVLAALVAAMLVGLGAMLEYLVHAWNRRN